MATLIVTLPLEMPAPGIEYDYVLSSDGQAAARQGRTAAALLPPLPGAGHEIVALAPARALSWHRVTLPARLLGKASPASGPSPQLRAALQGLLEDQLLDEVTNLHFALAPTSGPAGAWVAVCQQAWLQAHLRTLDEARHPVARIVPEFEPAEAGTAPTLHITAGLEPAQIVRTDEGGVTVLPLGATALKLLAWPADAPVLAEAAVAAVAEGLLKRPVSLQSAHERGIRAARSGWNLAQFELARSGRTRALQLLTRSWAQLRHAPQWNAARWLLIVLLGTQVLALNALAWKERALLDDKQQAMRDILRQTFPEVTVVLDAPLQMERQLGVLQQATGAATPRDLESLLGALASASPTPLALNEIDYGAGELRLRGLQISALELSTLSPRLQAQGYSLRSEGSDWLIRAEGQR